VEAGYVGMMKRGKQVYLSYITETLIPKGKRPCDVEIDVSLVLLIANMSKFR